MSEMLLLTILNKNSRCIETGVVPHVYVTTMAEETIFQQDHSQRG